ncbi:MAG: sporulation peptidase YabG [Halanaerobiales bacterium]
MEINPGDLVTRKSHGSDIIFKVERLEDNIAYLRSHRLRLMADAKIEDLVKLNLEKDNIEEQLRKESHQHLMRCRRNSVLCSDRSKKKIK